MSAFQIAEWEAYDRIDPIGTWRTDYHWASLEAMITNLMTWAHGKKGTKYTAADFIPNYTGEEKEVQQQSVEEMKEVFKSLASPAGTQTRKRTVKNKTNG